MTREEFINSLNIVLNQADQLSTIVYAVMKGNNQVKKLDIDNEEIAVIQGIFLQSINEKIITKEEQTIIRVSEADNRANTVFEYDLALPEGLHYYSSDLNDETPVFSFQDDDLTNIDSLIIKIGNEQNHIKLYKKLSPVEVFGRGGFLLWKANNRLERFEDKVLRLTPNFDALFVNNNYVFLSLKLLESSFGFHEVIVREATNSLQLLAQIAVLDSVQGLQDLLGKTSFARKVAKIRNSPVFTKNIPNDRIIAFTKSHPSLINKMKYNEEDTQIILKTKLSKELFIKMLDDAYLISQLTDQNYESTAKDVVSIVIEEE